MPALAEIRDWCAQARPLFICGLARSGTSMLQVAFARHSAMFDIKNCRETHIFVRPNTPMEDPLHVPTKLYLRGKPNLLAFREQVRSLQGPSGALSEADLIRAFFWYASTAVYDGRQPLEKTPGHLKKLPLMFDLFPKARVVVCSREPLDVVASYRKRLLKSRAEGMDEKKLAWLDKTPEEMVEVFRRFTKLVEAARPRFGKAMFMAPYEWLVASPSVSLRQVCAFADMPFEPALVRAGAAPAAADASMEDDDDTLDESTSIKRRESDAHKLLTPAEIDIVVNGTREWVDMWRKPGVLG